MLISMGNRNVGQGQPTYIVCEAGPTHTGVESAISLAEHAKAAGADAIKFQIADHNRLIADKDLMFSYGTLADRKTGAIEEVTEPLIDIWKRRWMPWDDWRKVKGRCNEIGIDFFATIFFEEDIEFLMELGVNSLKVSSQDIRHEELIRYCARQNVPLQLDTGNATVGEVERAVDWVRAEGNEQVIINHCPSGYPARLEGINLNLLKTLRAIFPHPIAFSDHTPGWEMDIAARAMGADIIEKTITLDRSIRSCEHVMSLEPTEIQRFVQAIRQLDVALGASRRTVTVEERERWKGVQRSGYLVRNVQAGERLSREDFDFRRPGYGILETDSYRHYLGRTYVRELPAGHMLQAEDLA